MKARSGFPCVKKTPQLGPKMAPKLGFQFEAPTCVALYVHTGNPKSRARFRCPELSCFWNPFEFNNKLKSTHRQQDFFDSILFASTLKKTKNAVDTRVLGLLNLSLAGTQDKAVLHCSRAIFLALWRSLRLPYLLELISCPLFVSPKSTHLSLPATLPHLNSQQNPADIHANTHHPPSHFAPTK